MKRIYSTLMIVAFLLIGMATSQAAVPADECTIQPTHKATHEEIQMQKIAFYSQQLKLTTSEAEKFWPLYNEYWEACGNARTKTAHALKALEDATAPGSNMSDSEIEALADAYFSSFKAESQLPVTYFEKFKKILPTKKAAKIFYTEEKFRRILIKQFRNTPPAPPQK